MKILSEQWGEVVIDSGLIFADVEPLENGNYKVTIDSPMEHIELEAPPREQTNDKD